MNAKANDDQRTVTFSAPGDLVSTNAETLHREIGELLDARDEASPKWELFKLDLTRARIVDSMGLNLIALLLKRVRKNGAKMQVAYAHKNVLRVFIFTRLDRHVELVNVGSNAPGPGGAGRR